MEKKLTLNAYEEGKRRTLDVSCESEEMSEETLEKVARILAKLILAQRELAGR